MAAAVRIGVLTPSSNTCLEPVVAALLAPLAPEVSLHVARVPVTRIGLDDRERAQFADEQMLAAARLLADAEVTLIAWGGTAGSWLGVGRDRELCQRIASELGVAATTSTLALLDALELYGVRRYGLAVPYTDDVAERIVAVYAHEGLECAGYARLGISRNLDFDRVDPARLRRLVAEAASWGEAVAVVCTNLRAAPLVEELEQSLGVVVVDSVVATLWKCLELAGAPCSLAGFGDLALNGSLRTRLQQVLRTLLERTRASRVTVRLDLPERGLEVDRAAAEALAPGVAPIRHDGSLDQWAMPTVQQIARERRTLVQGDVATEGPPVSAALVEVYGVRAQLLEPLCDGERTYGWISVHEVAHTRRWEESDIAALAQAAARVQLLLAEGARGGGVPARA